MVSLGLRDVGFDYLVLDDCWAERNRTEDGYLVGSAARFPSGMKAMGEYIHSKGLKYGIYGDAGTLTCAKYPGSLGYERQDAQMWAEWEVDYLKYDNCHARRDAWILDRYAAMRDALAAAGRPIVYSLCQWGVMEAHLWGPQMGHSWRTTEDIRPTWDSVLKTLDYNVGLSRFAGADRGWLDLDMLYVGNDTGLSPGEQRAHFALWSLYKSPLMIGHDLRDFSKASLGVLLSKEVIAINQDNLGVPGDLVWRQGHKRIYAGPLSGGARAVVLANFQFAHPTAVQQWPRTNVTLFWHQIGLQPGQRARVRDLYTGRDLGEFYDSFTGEVPVHDVLALRITPLQPPYDEGWRPWHGQPAYEAQPANVAVQHYESWVPKDAPWKYMKVGGEAAVYQEPDPSVDQKEEKKGRAKKRGGGGIGRG
ncbi:Alpha-galactosidase [Micractinium conductrix]|uniref:Alpha-galactosidase n=1 Tax=Micractinium conductrix TaxID=554055 RepID=A0A2P6VP14_9CHLO|nr:Alpha-galactosidase [Micractinium conductrix]|eukprot:PSC75843.1 Alpha-galactosidase [Micractinium conductrix]